MNQGPGQRQRGPTGSLLQSQELTDVCEASPHSGSPSAPNTHSYREVICDPVQRYPHITSRSTAGLTHGPGPGLWVDTCRDCAGDLLQPITQLFSTPSWTFITCRQITCSRTHVIMILRGENKARKEQSQSFLHSVHMSVLSGHRSSRQCRFPSLL